MLMRHGCSLSVRLTRHSRPHTQRYAATLAPQPLAKFKSRPSQFISAAHFPRLVTSSRRLLHSTQSLQQNPSADPSKDDRPIAVLGGGITGMATAHYLAESFPHREIVIFENKDVLGGWVQSDIVDVGDGEVIFESGPRSLRPNPLGGLLTLLMVQRLGLVDDLLPTYMSSPAAQNRFIYYPDHLVRMPGPGMTLMQLISSLWSEPVFDKLTEAIVSDIRTEQRSPELKDESVGSFISRRCHESIANNMLSALFHGIYAGDIWRLSAKNILPDLWAKEGKQGSFFKAYWDQVFGKRFWGFADDVGLTFNLQSSQLDPKLEAKVKGCSVYTFKRGMAQLTTRLEEHLSQVSNVTIMKSTEVTKISQSSQQDNTSIQVSHKDGKDASSVTQTYSHLVSTIPPRSLLPLVDFNFALSDPEPSRKNAPAVLDETIGDIPAVTVCVVNLYYRTPGLLQKVSPPGGLPSTLGPLGLRGFGYLLPASLPFNQNPERALGVIFDSDISPDLYSTVPEDKAGTRLTVMLGGHWWDGWTSYPSLDEAEEMAKSVLERHLGITEEPVLVRPSLQRDCIPQYHVGHSERMSQAHEALWDTFGGRLRVAGAWYTGVGVNDCIRAAWDVTSGIAADEDTVTISQPRIRRTGLEKFAGERPMMLLTRQSSGVYKVLQGDENLVANDPLVKKLLQQSAAVEKKQTFVDLPNPKTTSKPASKSRSKSKPDSRSK